MVKKSKAAPAADGLKVEYWPIERVISYARNSRLHSDGQVDAIAASIAEFGFVNPCLVDADGVLIAGHGRVLAMRKLERDKVPVIRLGHLTENQAKALRIADNQLPTLASWDADMLRLELNDLQLAGYNMPLLGFDDVQLVSFMANVPNGTDPEATPEPPQNPVSRLGDLWQLGKHLILCGDSADIKSTKRIDAVSATMLLSDPPYGIGFDYRSHDDDKSKNAELVSEVFALGPRCKVWTPGKMNLSRDIVRFGEAKVLCWYKGFAAAGNGLGGASTWEPVLVVNAKHAKLANDYLPHQTDREKLDGKMLVEHHPCPKPVSLFKELVEAFSPLDGKIYEPFSGSGTTLMACEVSGRACCAIEIDPAYVDVTVKRWQQFAKAEATLIGDGRTFAEVAKARKKPPGKKQGGSRKPAPAQAAE